MARTYSPPNGSTAAKVIAHLEKHGGSLERDRIAKLCGIKPVGVSSNLRSAVNAGLLEVERTAHGFSYSLAAAGAPAKDEQPSKLLIGCYSDGDVVVKGGTLNVDDSVTYTREQLQQLLEHCTRPHVLPFVALTPTHMSEAMLPAPAGSART